MCFSATGSFGLAVVLTGVGAVSIAQNESASHRLLAGIPLLFAAQQASEGVVWLTVAQPNEHVIHRLAVMAFLGIAMVVWPTWSPASLWIVERDPTRRRVLLGLLCLGGFISAGSALFLVHWPPVAVVAGHSIRYDDAKSASPLVGIILALAYIAPTVGPFFVATMKRARTIGVTLVLALVITFVVEAGALTSVWCFFAAILSTQIVVALRRDRA